MEMEILAAISEWISCGELRLTDLMGHDGKVAPDMNFILSPY